MTIQLGTSQSEPGRALTRRQDDQRSVLMQIRHQVTESPSNESPDS